MSGQLALGDWAPPLNPALSQWHTPYELAVRMVEWAGVNLNPGMTVLEPSAGGGSIVHALVAAGADVVAFEIDTAWAHAFKQDPTFKPVICTVADFLDVPPQDGAVDLAVMNPPLDGGVGPAHVARALEWAPRVVSVLRGGDLFGVEHHRVLWSRSYLSGIAWCVRRPVFGGSGAATDFVVVDVRRDDPGTAPRLEWW